MIAAPAVIAAGAARSRVLRPWLVALAGCLVVVFVVLVVGVFGAIVGLRTPGVGGSRPSRLARREIPPRYLRLYQAAGQRYGIDPWILAAIGSIETGHGRSTAAGVRSGVNFAGCCAGPMQFSVIGSPSTWDSYGVDGDHDGQRSPYDPADAIPAAARYLRASGAPANYQAAILAYNHAQWYVDEVLATARQYRAAAPAPTGGQTPIPADAAAALRDVLHSSRITLSAVQRADLRSGAIDARVIDALDRIAHHHTVVVTALKSDHPALTVDGIASNHAAGRAVDVGTVDGERCQGTVTGRCATLVRELADVTGRLRSTELIYCWDPDGPTDPRGFARADHCDHIHVGWDG